MISRSSSSFYKGHWGKKQIDHVLNICVLSHSTNHIHFQAYILGHTYLLVRTDLNKMYRSGRQRSLLTKREAQKGLNWALGNTKAPFFLLL